MSTPSGWPSASSAPPRHPFEHAVRESLEVLLTRSGFALPALCSAAIFVACSSGPESFGPGPPRNLILISIDTLRQDRLGAYGYDRPTSPTLDRVAGEGTVFTSAVATSPWTVPSHASLLTGFYPQRHRMRNYKQRLDPSIPTLAERLADAGLETLAIVSSKLLAGKYDLARGFQHFQHVSEWSNPPEGPRRLRDPGAEVTDLALRWLEDRDEQPFFLFLHYYDPHSDYDPSPDQRRRFVSRYSGPIDGSTSQLLLARRGELVLSEEDVRHLSDLYDAEIRQLDDQLERLFEYLDGSGLSSETLVVVTSDHGEEFMEHGSVLHGRTYFDEVITVPLCVRGPGVAPGVRIDALVSLVDVAPTLLHAVDAAVPEELEGVDLSAYWNPRAQPLARPYVFAEADWMNAKPDSFEMVRDERHKLIVERATGATRLYDLELDPAETRDRSAEQPEPLARLLAQLRAFETGEATEAGERAPTQSELERLRALGYAE